MKPTDMLAIDGVFLAVKCSNCGAIHSADSDDYVAFYGSVSAGIDRVIVGVDAPKRPAKKSMKAVCRTPDCIETLVRTLLGCDSDQGDARELWAQALTIWAGRSGHALVEASASGPKAVALQPKAKLKAKAR